MSPFLYLCGFISHLFTVSTLLFLCALYLLTINLSWLQDLLSYNHKHSNASKAILKHWMGRPKRSFAKWATNLEGHYGQKKKKVEQSGPEGSENKENIPEHAPAERACMATALVHPTPNQTCQMHRVRTPSHILFQQLLIFKLQSLQRLRTRP